MVPSLFTLSLPVMPDKTRRSLGGGVDVNTAHYARRCGDRLANPIAPHFFVGREARCNQNGGEQSPLSNLNRRRMQSILCGVKGHPQPPSPDLSISCFLLPPLCSLLLRSADPVLGTSPVQLNRCHGFRSRTRWVFFFLNSEDLFAAILSPLLALFRIL